MIDPGLFLGLLRRSVAPSGPPPAYIPSLDFSDARNSQYLVLLFDDLA